MAALGTKSMRAAAGLALLVAVAAPAAAAPLAPGDETRQLQVGQTLREYDVHVPPSYDGSQPVPLVLDFHGLTSNKEQQATLSGLKALADEEGFLIAHPNGLDASWNAGLCCPPATTNGVDDVGFARALVAAISADANVDASRVYASGLSNGGAMTQRLACEASDLFAGAVPMAFALPFADLLECAPSHPIPVLTVMSRNDSLVPFEGNDGFFQSARDSFERWRDANQCAGVDPDTVLRRGQAQCEAYTDCAGGVTVALCHLIAAEFGGTFFDGHIVYLNDDLDLARVAHEFLTTGEIVMVPEPGAAASALAALAAVALLALARRRRAPPRELRAHPRAPCDVYSVLRARKSASGA